MRRINVETITQNIKEMCIEANHFLSPDMKKVFDEAAASEESPLGRQILGQLEENLCIAGEEMIPICQDTGMAVVFIKVGQDVHLVGSFAMTKAVVPYMKEQKRGRIIFQASMTSYIGQPQVAGYSTAKAGFLGMIHTLTAELAEYGITVNAIAPGWIDTPMFHKAVDNDPPRLAKIMGRIPAKTVGDPMDVGMCAAFLSSDAARYISGSCIPVDGGALIGF